MYKRCGASRLARSVYAFRKRRDYWPVWASLFFYGGVSAPIAFGDDDWFWNGMFLTVLAFFPFLLG